MRKGTRGVPVLLAGYPFLGDVTALQPWFHQGGLAVLHQYNTSRQTDNKSHRRAGRKGEAGWDVPRTVISTALTVLMLLVL